MNETYSHNALPAGTKIHEFVIERVLGSGSFGIVYLAENRYFEEIVALKEFLPNDLASRKEDSTVVPLSSNTERLYEYALQNFLKEARILRELFRKQRHPSIVEVTQYMEDKGTAYMVMTYEKGRALSRVMEERGTLKQDELIRILKPLLDGLERVHGESVWHRDIKPDNILIREDGSPVLIDFGAARREIGSNEKSKIAVFTPNYAAPEQVNPAMGEQGPWTDIYSIGATLYRGVTGEAPVNASDRMQGQDYVPVGLSAKGDYRPGFLEAIDAALALKPQDRPQSIKEWRRLLKLSPETAGVEDNDKTRIADKAKLPRKTPKATRWILAAAVTLSFVLAAVVIVGIFPKKEAPIITPPTTTEATTTEAATTKATTTEATTTEAATTKATTTKATTTEAATTKATTTKATTTEAATTKATTTKATTTEATTTKATTTQATTTEATTTEAATTKATTTEATTTEATTTEATTTSVNTTVPAITTAPPQRDKIMAHVKQVLSEFGCAFISPVLANRRLSLAGSVSSKEVLEQVRSKLRQIQGVEIVEDGLAIHPKSFCDMMALLKSHRVNIPSGLDRTYLKTSKAEEKYKEGEHLVVNAFGAFEGYLYIDFLDIEGNVVHMLPSPVSERNKVYGGQEIVIGKDKRRYKISPPHGRNIIVAITSAQRLFDTTRREIEPAKKYFSALDAALQQTRRLSENRITVAFQFVDTQP